MSTMKKTRYSGVLRRIGCTILMSLACIAGAKAQPAYPNKPVRIIVPFSAGGSGDVVTRLVAQALSIKLKQPFIVENKPGAGGAVGAQAAARATPDGYTLAFISSGHTWLDAMNPGLGFHINKELEAIALLCSTPYVVLARKDAPFHSIAELVAYAKENPDKVTMASAGVGTLTHLLPAWMMAETGIQLNHIPYPGTAPAMTALLGGQVDIYADPVATSAPHIHTGKVQALATTGNARVPSLSQVPTLKELGIPVAGETWFGLMAPRNTPRNIIDQLNIAVNEVLGDAAFRARMKEMSFTITPGTVESFSTFIDEQTKVWTEVVRQNKISVK